MSKLRTVRTNHVVRHRKVVLELRCELTAEEQRLKGIQLADLDQKIAAKQEQKKLQNELITDELKDLSRQVAEIALEVRQGWEERQIPCLATYDYALAKVVTCREDTGQVVDERAMTEDERQTTFYTDEGEVLNYEARIDQ